MRFVVPVKACVPRIAGLDQDHPDDSSDIVAVALKLILLPQPTEMEFHVAILEMVGMGNTVTFIVYDELSEASTVYLIVPLVVPVVDLNVWDTVDEATVPFVFPLTLITLEVVQVNVLPLAGTLAKTKRSCVVPLQNVWENPELQKQHNHRSR